MHKYSVWCICHVRGRNFYYFEKSSRWAKFTSNSHPTIVTNTNLLNFHFPISNFLRTGGHAQKQIVKINAGKPSKPWKFLLSTWQATNIFFYKARKKRKCLCNIFYFRHCWCCLIDRCKHTVILKSSHHDKQWQEHCDDEKCEPTTLHQNNEHWECKFIWTKRTKHKLQTPANFLKSTPS